jgi:hypothetical protein
MKLKDVQNASPALQALGVPESVQRDGTYGEYDVQISVSFSPAKGQQQFVANKVVRMSAAKYTAYREDTNLWTGEDFLKNEFADKWDELQKQAEEQQRSMGNTYVYNNYTGERTDGQSVESTWNPAKSSVAVNLQNPNQVKPDVTRAPAALKESDYTAPVMGPEANYEEGNVPVFAYEANDTNDYKVPENVQNVGGEDPQLPEQQKPANPKKGKPEQDGTNTAEQPDAATVVEKAQGGETPATKASKEGNAQTPNPSKDPETVATPIDSAQDSSDKSKKSK